MNLVGIKSLLKVNLVVFLVIDNSQIILGQILALLKTSHREVWDI